MMMKKQILCTTVLAMTMSLTVVADDWMGRLDDNLYVMQMSIPGTHDAATGDGFTWGEIGDLFGKTQDLNLSDQWKAGVRAFDLCPSVEDKDNGTADLVIYHGILATNTRFADALRLLCDSLKAHPSEFAIVLMRFEDDNGGSRTTWNKLVTELLNSDEIKAMTVDFTPRLTLGDVRGKLLIASRDTYGSTPVGAFISGWSHSSAFDQQKNAKIRGRSSSCTLYAQDFYELTEDGALQKKVSAITSMLDFSTKLHTRRTILNCWIINHCSGYTQSASADGNRDCAATTNKAVIDYLSDENHAGPTGLIMMDFAGTNHSGNYDVMGQTLVQAIIDNNFRYQAMTSGITPPPALSSEEEAEHAANQTVYDLQGRKMKSRKTMPNIYIQNGKKHLSR